jgi:hypothetical protein
MVYFKYVLFYSLANNNDLKNRDIWFFFAIGSKARQESIKYICLRNGMLNKKCWKNVDIVDIIDIVDIVTKKSIKKRMDKNLIILY